MLGGRRGYLVVEGRDLSRRGSARSWSSAGSRASGTSSRRHARASGAARRAAAWSGSRSRPTTSPSRSRSAARVYVRGAGSTARRGAAEHGAAVAQRPVEGRRDADAGARGRVRARAARSSSPATGVRVLLAQAAGIVISLLVAFSLVALVAAGTMLAAGAHADVQRRLTALRRAARARLLARRGSRRSRRPRRRSSRCPAAALGHRARRARRRAARRPTCSPRSTSSARAGALARAAARARWLAVVAASSSPPRRGPPGAPRGARPVGDPARRRRRRRAPRALARSAAAGSPRSARGSRPPRAGAGSRRSRRSRVCAGVVTLMLALASLLERLRDDPGTVGKRYQLTVALDPLARRRRARRSRAWRDVAPRYAVDAADSFRLGEPVRLVAYPGDHTRFEAPPLADGPADPRRRTRSRSGVGLADALGLRPGSRARGAAPERRARCASASCGIVRALENDGRIAWVRPDRLLDRDPTSARRWWSGSTRGADRAAVDARGWRRSARRRSRSAARTTDNAAFLAVLAAVLRGVGLAVGLVCLYALVQALTDDRARAPRRGRAAARRAAPTRRPSRSCSRARRSRSRSRRRARRRRARGGSSSARSSPASPRASPRCRSRRRRGQVALVVGGLLAAGRAPRPRSWPRRVAARAGRRGAEGGMMRAAPPLARRSPLARARARRLRRRRAPRAAPPATRRSHATLVDPDGDGFLERGPGEPLVDRGGRGALGRTLATFGQLTDTHVRDEESPARVPFLDRLGAAVHLDLPPAGGVLDPVLDAAVRALNRERPQAVVRHRRHHRQRAAQRARPGARASCDGGRVDPDSGAPGYDGVQAAPTPRPFYYRPDHDAPAPPRRARRRPAAVQGRRPAGALVPGWSATTTCSSRARCRRPTRSTRSPPATGSSPALDPALPAADVDEDERPAGRRRAARAGERSAAPTRVPADPAPPPPGARRADRAARRRRAPACAAAPGRLDYTVDLGPRCAAIVLDTVDRDGGSRGVRDAGASSRGCARSSRAATAGSSSSPTTR